MELTLAEELLLLGLDDESGEIILSVSTALPYGIAGAILLELHLRNKISLTGDSVKVTDPTETGDSILDEVLNLIKIKIEAEEAKYWIRTINGSVDDLMDRLIDGLVNKGVLKKEEKKILWIIPIDRFPTKDPLPEVHTRILIRAIVLENQEPTERTLALLSLVRASNLIDELFLKDERRQAENIINEMINNESIGKAVADINAEVTAIISSSVAGTVAAASVVGNF
ncbi:MAG: GPP34 family phosphoprotein [Candidatus Kapabacteria bacterium]|nr:GPP34 family phosphoprotein [Ignavibacteriota bacterium]MCW5885244.1 GPP34 family phosphoprotein [Candidatus Kapabacteria bacterium]